MNRSPTGAGTAQSSQPEMGSRTREMATGSPPSCALSLAPTIRAAPAVTRLLGGPQMSCQMYLR